MERISESNHIHHPDVPEESNPREWVDSHWGPPQGCCGLDNFLSQRNIQLGVGRKLLENGHLNDALKRACLLQDGQGTPVDLIKTSGYLPRKHYLVRECPSKLIFLLEQLNRYTGKEEIAKDTIIAKLTCHDLDKPPDTIHYAPCSGPVGSGQLFEQVPNAENFIQVSPCGCYSPRKWSIGTGDDLIQLRIPSPSVVLSEASGQVFNHFVPAIIFSIL